VSDTFRRRQTPVSSEIADRIENLKRGADLLVGCLQDLYSATQQQAGEHLAPATQIGARELALARTKLEECVMWATKGATA